MLPCSQLTALSDPNVMPIRKDLTLTRCLLVLQVTSNKHNAVRPTNPAHASSVREPGCSSPQHFTSLSLPSLHTASLPLALLSCTSCPTCASAAQFCLHLRFSSSSTTVKTSCDVVGRQRGIPPPAIGSLLWERGIAAQQRGVATGSVMLLAGSVALLCRPSAACSGGVALLKCYRPRGMAGWIRLGTAAQRSAVATNSAGMHPKVHLTSFDFVSPPEHVLHGQGRTLVLEGRATLVSQRQCLFACRVPLGGPKTKECRVWFVVVPALTRKLRVLVGESSQSRMGPSPGWGLKERAKEWVKPGEDGRTQTGGEGKTANCMGRSAGGGSAWPPQPACGRIMGRAGRTMGA